MPRRNRVDPSGDLHAVAQRGLFTGNRGCLVDDTEQVVRHHRGNLWITCVLEYGERRVGLARPDRWTPIFFLDDAVALAAGHRPCGECRWRAYLAYRDAVSVATGTQMRAGELNRLLATERLRRGHGVARAADRRTWTAPATQLPDGTVVRTDGPRLVLGGALHAFAFDGWHSPAPLPDGPVTVLTPPTSVAALRHGFRPVLHPTAQNSAGRDQPDVAHVHQSSHTP
ncbi:hypothetical protein [Pseudonocardia sp. GCM10023141]|uniref:hypothetical protein n=1 Tax=Pseudonocardia sp. GCM10023141 TaxID=3252653 RepID=UPI00361234CC